MRLLAGDAEVEWVFGRVVGNLGEDSSDDLHAADLSTDEDQGMEGQIRFANGVDGFIHYKPTFNKGIEVVGTKGKFATDFTSFHLWTQTDESSEAQEVADAFPSVTGGQQYYDDDGWLNASSRVMDTVQSVVDAVDQGIEPRASGDNGRRVLEIAIGLRESERQGMTPVKFPLEDRSLRIIPKRGRLLNKKEVYGREWYASQIGRHTKA